ncbi:Rieske (2Fe-2S) protein [Streptomyces sp. NPDC057020]|uniref:Rieske (2Fe-2S) protein n=1 Tax=unclassified Streptomyces TaxID=2593676 RepID=UPI0009A0CD82|nr:MULTISPECIES: Rieske 2Fe-2S domain-containing protein [unclassified Streptomyces]MCD2467779.1 Rieske 2Fe-2S domain-containing protein [Streptomyces sp. MBT42]
MTAVPAGRRRGSDEPTVRQVTEDLVLVEVGGRKVLAAAVCPHRGGRLKYGRVDGDRLRITCPLHHTTFDLTSGARLAGAACADIRVVDVLPGDLSVPEQRDPAHDSRAAAPTEAAVQGTAPSGGAS